MAVEPIKKTKPVAGAIWGLVFGIGLGLMAIDRRMVTIGFGPIVLFAVIGLVLGVVWSLFGPAKAAKGGPPVEASPGPPFEPPTSEATAIDDVDATPSEVGAADSDAGGDSGGGGGDGDGD